MPGTSELSGSTLTLSDSYYNDGKIVLNGKQYASMQSDIRISLDTATGQLCITFAPANYSTSKRYVVGEYCYYSNKAYICKSNTPNPAGSFNSQYWREL